jgi:hypothetical protein
MESEAEAVATNCRTCLKKMHRDGGPALREHVVFGMTKLIARFSRHSLLSIISVVSFSLQALTINWSTYVLLLMLQIQGMRNK